MKRPSLKENIMAERFAGLKEGDKVLCEGFNGRVTKLCEWSLTPETEHGMVEVTLERGHVCVTTKYLVRR